MAVGWRGLVGNAENGAEGGAVAADEAEGGGDEFVATKGGGGEVEVFDDDDIGAVEGVVVGQILARELVHRRGVEADEFHAGRAEVGGNAGGEHGPRGGEAGGVAPSAGADEHAGGAGEIEVGKKISGEGGPAGGLNDPNGTEVGFEGDLVDGGAVVAVVKRGVGVGAVVQAEGELADVAGVAVADAGVVDERNADVAGPGRGGGGERAGEVDEAGHGGGLETGDWSLGEGGGK